VTPLENRSVKDVVLLVLALAGIAFLGALMTSEGQPLAQETACEAASPGSVFHLTSCSPDRAPQGLALAPSAVTTVVASGAPARN
jgi:hypothetical protein